MTAEEQVAKDSPDLWSWVIFPEGFHAPTIMEHARLQAWTLKPAVLDGSVIEPPHTAVFEIK